MWEDDPGLPAKLDILEQQFAVNRAFILSTLSGWDSSVAAPGTIKYDIGINNPDPVQWIWLYGHVFTGMMSART